MNIIREYVILRDLNDYVSIRISSSMNYSTNFYYITLMDLYNKLDSNDPNCSLRLEDIIKLEGDNIHLLPNISTSTLYNFPIVVDSMVRHDKIKLEDFFNTHIYFELYVHTPLPINIYSCGIDVFVEYREHYNLDLCNFENLPNFYNDVKDSKELENRNYIIYTNDIKHKKFINKSPNYILEELSNTSSY